MLKPPAGALVGLRAGKAEANGVLGVVAKRMSVVLSGLPLASTAESARWPSWWQAWQLGTWNQPTRPAVPTLLILPWQLWQLMARLPWLSSSVDMAPRMHCVVEPGWHW